MTDDTRIRRDHEDAALSALKVGDHVWTLREKTGDGSFETRAVHALSAERYAEMEKRRAEMEQRLRACEAGPSQCPAGPKHAFGRSFGGPHGRPPAMPGGEPTPPRPSMAA